MTLVEQRKRKQEQWAERLKKLQAVEAWYQTYPLIPAYRPRLIDPSPFWHTVYRQKHAFEVAAAHPEEVHVFAFEADNITVEDKTKGQRKFVVTNYQQLWHTVYHLAARAKYPSFYEVIPEGSACKLYFDLEFNRSLNPECNGVEMVQTFIKFVRGEISKVYHIQCDIHQVINLDATTDTKFSRHLIYNIPQIVFKDNVQAGNFVHHVCQKITRICQTTENQTTESDREPDAKKKKHQEETERDGGPDHMYRQCMTQLQKLFVLNKDGHFILFVDQGVYTRNRNFRLYKCIKRRKSNPLLVADDCQYKPHIPKRSALSQPANQAATERQFFLDSLITSVSYCPSTRVLTMEHDEERSRRKPGQPGKKDYTDTQDGRCEQLEGFDHSPYPELDAFIYSVITIGGVQGTIRRWVYFSQGQLLVYDIIKNRWCGNVQRQHKSNNIMILVDLRHGVYYQKCHDPDCKAAGYKSPDNPIPAHLMPTFGDDIDDDELLAAVTAAEDHEAMVDRGPDKGDRTGRHGVGEVSDDELLAASLQVEGNMGLGLIELGAQEGVTSSLEGEHGLPDTGRDYCGDVTESDEELLAAVSYVEGRSTSFDDSASNTTQHGTTQ